MVTGVVTRDDVTAEGWFYRTSSRLTEVPADIPDNTTRVYLSYNRIVSLPSRIFSNLTRLETIDLDHNKISDVQPSAFAGTPTFWLDLQSNELSSIRRDMWEEQNSLMVLLLKYNRIISIESRSFEGLADLGVLHLEGNRIAELAGDEFHGLSNLTALHLDRNRLKSLPDGIFQGMENLELLTLTRNQIGTIPVNLFKGLKNLRNLFLDWNRITALAEGTLAFSVVPKLRQMSISNNHLTTLQRNVFIPEGSTEHQDGVTLSLDGNPMHCDAKMCWLTPGVQTGSRKWIYIYWNRVDCANYPGRRWVSLNLNCDE